MSDSRRTFYPSLRLCFLCSIGQTAHHRFVIASSSLCAGAAQVRKRGGLRHDFFGDRLYENLASVNSDPPYSSKVFYPRTDLLQEGLRREQAKIGSLH